MSSTQPRRHGLLALVLSAISALALVSTGDPVAAQGSPTTTLSAKDQRAETKKRRQEVNGEIGSLRSDDKAVRAAIDSIDARLAAANLSLADAAAKVAAAEAETEAARAAVEEARAVAEQVKADVKRSLLDAYVHPSSGGMAAVVASSSIADAMDRQTLLSLRARTRNDLLQRRRAALAELASKESAAKTALEQSKTAAQRQQAAVDEIESTRQAHVQLVAQVDQRLNAALGEAAALQSLDAQLASKIASDEQRLREDLLARQAAALNAAAAAAPTTTAPPSRKPGTATSTTAAAATTTTAVPRVVPPSIYTEADMEDVGANIKVNKLIAARVKALLGAATAAGITLGGAGFRDSAAQIQTRINNCGPSDYDIYEKPASQCSPPTAKPGTSMHEQGMAIDFTCDGVLISSRDNRCFLWLADNAARFGLLNLPSEPWHWSTNGN